MRQSQGNTPTSTPDIPTSTPDTLTFTPDTSTSTPDTSTFTPEQIIATTTQEFINLHTLFDTTVRLDISSRNQEGHIIDKVFELAVQALIKAKGHSDIMMALEKHFINPILKKTHHNHIRHITFRRLIAEIGAEGVRQALNLKY